jgi:hypothetical protein
LVISIWYLALYGTAGSFDPTTSVAISQQSTKYQVPYPRCSAVVCF